MVIITISVPKMGSDKSQLFLLTRASLCSDTVFYPNLSIAYFPEMADFIQGPLARGHSAIGRNRLRKLPPRGAQQEQEEIDVIQVQLKCAYDNQPTAGRVVAILLTNFFQLLCVPGCKPHEQGNAEDI